MATKESRPPAIAKRAGGKRARRRITAEDLLRFQWVADPQISPDGQRIVFVKKHVGDKNNYVRELWMVATDGNGEPVQFTTGGTDAQPRWSPDGTRIAFISGRDKLRPQIYVIAAAGGEAKAVTAFPEGALAGFRWSPDGTRFAASYRARAEAWTDPARKRREEAGGSTPPRVTDDLWYRLDGDGYFDQDRFQLFLVDAKSGAHDMVFNKDTLGTFSFDFAPDGRQLVIAANTDRRALLKPWLTDLYRYDIGRRKLTQVPNIPPGVKESVQWSPDGRFVAWAGRLDESGAYDTANLELFVADAATGGARSLTGREDYCLMAASVSDSAEADFGAKFRWSPDSRRLFMRIGWHGETHLASVRPRGGVILFHSSGDREFDFGSVSAKADRIGLVVSNPVELGEIHVGKLKGDGPMEVVRLTHFNGPLLSELELSRPRSQWIRAADGSRVQVWSIRPPGHTTNRRVPAVLEVHGGPHAQYGVSFFHEFQVLAAAGYAVFYSNPRGSKGYGRAHCEAIHGNWGSADWVDIQAVSAHMLEQPWVDPKRVAIMGGSYGGYMTNWAIGHTKMFRAAITDRCVSNLVSMAGSSDIAEEPGKYFPGNQWDQSEELWRQSPLKYFGNVKTPTLVIHSEGDLRCNVEQGEQVFTALKLRNVPTRLVRYPSSSSHGLSRGGPPDLRLHRLGQILEWFERWLR